MQQQIARQSISIRDEYNNLYTAGDHTGHLQSITSRLQATHLSYETNREMHQGCEQFKSVAQRKDCKVTKFNVAAL